MLSILAYPQLILLLAPVLLRAIWALSRCALLRLPAGVRAAILLSFAMTPIVAIAVPYVPALAEFLPVPWYPPIAWGVALWPDLTQTAPYMISLGAMCAVVFIPPTTFVVLFVRALIGSRALTRKLAITSHPAGFFFARGNNVACTVGLFRPRVLLSEDVWRGPHGAVVLRHEQTHARGRHPLVMLCARAMVTPWRWVPGATAFLEDLHLALEEHADECAQRDYGRVRVARALTSQATTRLAVGVALGFGNADTAERRLVALATPHTPAPLRSAVALTITFIAALVWVMLL